MYSKLEYIKCDTYNKTKEYKPVSFEPRLKWKITTSNFVDTETVKLPKHIVFVSQFCGVDVVVSSHPYSYGEFSVDCESINIHHVMLKTNDPEDALYLAEQKIINTFKHVIEYTLGLLHAFQGMADTQKYINLLKEAYEE